MNTIGHTLFPTAFGPRGLAWNDTGLTRFQLPEATPELTERSLVGETGSTPAATPPAWAQDIIARVRQHFEGALQDFSDVAIDWSRVSEFQQDVYRAALAIKPGRTQSYGGISQLLGLGPEGARAVGVALATNPWPLIVPCHRIVSASGKMTGFSAPGGVRTKTRLLVLEGAELISE
jgi:methylated-DNA-[protein]-cysteine S-methyltransferase